MLIEFQRQGTVGEPLIFAREHAGTRRRMIYENGARNHRAQLEGRPYSVEAGIRLGRLIFSSGGAVNQLCGWDLSFW